ncbi:hypothetical protein, partial [uncultured Lamprocystis sp.]|uniref:hypothetical protein n=1 Tax=uncultured Lamprocystis sp. TaxID=543132 RepID=UPI002600841F
LNGAADTLHRLAKATVPLPFDLVRRNQHYYLHSEQFFAATQAQDVTDKAKEWLSVLSALLRLENPLEPLITLDMTQWVDEQGEATGHPDSAAFYEMLKGAPDQPAVPREDLLDAALHDIAQWGHLLALSAEDPDIAVVLRWWGTKELDWFWLFKMYEIIENNVAGPNQSALLATRLKCDRSAIQSFQETACHPGEERGGEKARHSVPKNAPFHESMSLANARNLIAHLIRQWLTCKTNKAFGSRSRGCDAERTPV